jgi:tetratricopeptide (TPR) repeat protein
VAKLGEQSPFQERRVIRVFVSSTFRDMQDEREELIKRIFPQLRSLCESRGGTWVEVDLRWGITEEQQRQGQVLPICLAEARRCRPYFIGLLGERYGSVLNQFDCNVLAQEPWLAGQEGRSVTELEIEYAVLNDPAMAGHSYFYFRDPNYSREIESRIAGREPLDADSLRKLASLKNRIRKSAFPVRENYRSARELGELVLADFNELIDRLIPETSPQLSDRDLILQETFAAGRAAIHIGREAFLDTLDAHVSSNGPPLAVVGDSGIGKSALLACWLERYRAAHTSVFTFAHFFGASPASIDWTVPARRLIGQINRHYDLSVAVPDLPDALCGALSEALRLAGARDRLVVVLDALNQLEDRHNAPDLVWLPRHLPSAVRLIVSALPGRSLAEIERRGWPRLELPPLSQAERRLIIGEYLAQYAKALTSPQLEAIAAAPLGGNPLFLTSLLEELRLWGEHETVWDQITKYLSASSISELFAKILRRYETDYDGDRPGLVRDAMASIWAARRGLSESELRDLLGADGNPLPSALWSPLFHAAGRSLMGHAGLLGFFHEYFREAVRDRYLSTLAEQRAAHLRLADYFAPREGPRKIEELPWQLARAHEWDRLRDLLAELPFLEAATLAAPYDVFARWAELRLHRAQSPLEAYRALLQAPSAQPTHLLWHVAQLLQLLGHADASLPLLAVVGDRLQDAGALRSADPRLIRLIVENLIQQALARMVSNEAEQAFSLLEHARRMAAEGEWIEGCALALLNRGGLLRRQGRPMEAMASYREAENLLQSRAEIDQFLLARVKLGEADLLQHRQPAEALQIATEQERILRTIGNKESLAYCLEIAGSALTALERLDEALKPLVECEALCIESGRPADLQRVISKQSTVAFMRRDWNHALDLLRRDAELCRSIDNPFGLATSQKCQAWIAENIHSDLDGAVALLREREQVCRDLGDPDMIADALVDLGLLLMKRGDGHGALAKLQEAGRLWHERGELGRLATCILLQAQLREAGNELLDALRLYSEAEQLSRRAGDMEAQVNAVACQARAYARHVGMPAAALPGLLQAQRLAEDNGLIALADQLQKMAAELR